MAMPLHGSRLSGTRIYPRDRTRSERSSTVRARNLARRPSADSRSWHGLDDSRPGTRLLECFPPFGARSVRGGPRCNLRRTRGADVQAIRRKDRAAWGPILGDRSGSRLAGLGHLSDPRDPILPVVSAWASSPLLKRACRGNSASAPAVPARPDRRSSHKSHSINALLQRPAAQSTEGYSNVLHSTTE